MDVSALGYYLEPSASFANDKGMAGVRPIHELLSRIRWDPEFAQAHVEIGYYDRVADRVLRLPLAALAFDPDDHFDFEWQDDAGVTHSIPLHRIRQVYRDGKLIWERPAR